MKPDSNGTASSECWLSISRNMVVPDRSAPTIKNGANVRCERSICLAGLVVTAVVRFLRMKTCLIDLLRRMFQSAFHDGFESWVHDEILLPILRSLLGSRETSKSQ